MGKMIMALKKLAKKVNGKAPESDNVVGIINGMADDYQGSSGNSGYTLNIKNNGNEDLYIILFQYDNGVLNAVDETIENDDEYHTFNNVVAVKLEPYSNADAGVSDLVGITIGGLTFNIGVEHGTGFDECENTMQLVTNVQMTVFAIVE